MVLISRPIQVILLLSLTLKNLPVVFALSSGGGTRATRGVYVVCISALQHTRVVALES